MYSLNNKFRELISQKLANSALKTGDVLLSLDEVDDFYGEALEIIDEEFREALYNPTTSVGQYSQQIDAVKIERVVAISITEYVKAQRLKQSFELEGVIEKSTGSEVCLRTQTSVGSVINHRVIHFDPFDSKGFIEPGIKVRFNKGLMSEVYGLSDIKINKHPEGTLVTPSRGLNIIGSLGEKGVLIV